MNSVTPELLRCCPRRILAWSFLVQAELTTATLESFNVGFIVGDPCGRWTRQRSFRSPRIRTACGPDGRFHPPNSMRYPFLAQTPTNGSHATHNGSRANFDRDVTPSNLIRQRAATGKRLDGTAERWERRSALGELFTATDGKKILVVPKKLSPPAGIDAVLVVPSAVTLGQTDSGFAEVDASQGRWSYPKLELLEEPADDHGWQARRQAARDSWQNRLEFREERRDGQGNVQAHGLRTPQIGALHAILAHWTVTIDPATVVMPTGTGKTETMLASLLSVQPECMLVIVPTDALREQISRKFQSLGAVKPGVLNGPVTAPIVGTLKKRPKSPGEVRAFFHAAMLSSRRWRWLVLVFPKCKMKWRWPRVTWLSMRHIISRRGPGPTSVAISWVNPYCNSPLRRFGVIEST